MLRTHVETEKTTLASESPFGMKRALMAYHCAPAETVVLGAWSRSTTVGIRLGFWSVQSSRHCAWDGARRQAGPAAPMGASRSGRPLGCGSVVGSAEQAAHEAVTVVFVVMNWAVPGFTISGSGCGPAGVGIMAGDCTLKMAWNVWPFSNIGLPLGVVAVRFAGDSMIWIAPVPGITYGGGPCSNGPRPGGGGAAPRAHPPRAATSPTLAPAPHARR